MLYRSEITIRTEESKYKMFPVVFVTEGYYSTLDTGLSTKNFCYWAMDNENCIIVKQRQIWYETGTVVTFVDTY